MNVRRLAVLLISTPLTAALLALGWASPASAVTLNQKLTVMSNWTQTSVSSYDGWNAARQNQSAWASYQFNWSTDYCSASPDQPLGFDFRLSCWRHDFGYRNYKAVNLFPSSKARVDDAFYADLKRRCATYNQFVRPSCYSLAWTYYEAVRVFGNLRVDQASLDRAAKLKAEGEAQARAAGLEHELTS